MGKLISKLINLIFIIIYNLLQKSSADVVPFQIDATICIVVAIIFAIADGYGNDLTDPKLIAVASSCLLNLLGLIFTTVLVKSFSQIDETSLGPIYSGDADDPFF